MKPITRRHVFGQSIQWAGTLAAGMTVGGAADRSSSSKPKPKIIVAGAHPDDPETGCGGTIARFADLQYEVVILYLTRGERGIKGKSYEEAAVVRSAEAQKACEILKARPAFAGQVNGRVEVNYDRYDQFRTILVAEHPDAVFAHWPIDTHEDHRANSLLVYDAWLRMGRRFALYYFEVMTGMQTSQFLPTHFVDISPVEPRKRAACFAHASQEPDEFYRVHDEMNRFRGLEFGCKYAEAFIHHEQSPEIDLPPRLP